MNREQIAEYFFKQFYTKDLESERFSKASKEDQQAMIDRGMTGCRDHADKLLTALADKDWLRLKGFCWLHNKASRHVISQLIGTKLPSTFKGTREVIRQWIGADEFDRQIAEAQSKHDKERQTKEQARLEERMNRIAKQQVRTSDGHITTFKAFMEGAIQKGYVHVITRKVGIVPVMQLHNSEGEGFKFRKKDEREFVEWMLSQTTQGATP